MLQVAQASITLPEGATVTVIKYESARKTGGVGTHTQIIAYRGDKRVEMRVDDLSAHNVTQYLQMFCREIQRRRERLTEKPAGEFPKPQDVTEFVSNMAYNDMFIFGADVLQPEPATVKPKRKRRSRARKKGDDMRGKLTNGEMPF